VNLEPTEWRLRQCNARAERDDGRDDPCCQHRAIVA
jgi:hypothetical protein